MNASSSSSGRLKVGIALRQKASWLHHRLTQANAMNAPMGEETITETLLLDLALELGPHLAVSPFTKHVESHETGADWEWWFCDGQGQPVFGMRVQAKKLKRTRAGALYYDLGYTPRNGKRQVDRLCDAAAASNIPAVYALYNGPELDLSHFPWPCCREPESPSVFGISMLSGGSARHLADHAKMTLVDVGPLSLPWSCCALCPHTLGLNHVPWPPGDALGADVGELAFYIGDMVTGLLVREAQLLGVRAETRALGGPQGFRAWNDAPQYVRSIVDRNVDRRFTQRQGLDDLDLELPEGLAGIAVWIARPSDASRATGTL